MSEPIKAGDTVQVIRPTPCCGSTVGLGTIYEVIHVSLCEQQCDCCGEMFGTYLVARWYEPHPEQVGRVILHGHAIERVKKIPPLEEPLDVKRDTEIEA